VVEGECALSRYITRTGRVYGSAQTFAGLLQGIELAGLLQGIEGISEKE
jgi:hypothetical protein